MKKTLFQVTLGTLFLMLVYAAPGRAQSECNISSLIVTLESETVTAGNGVFDYYLTAPAPCFLPSGDSIDIDFTNLGGDITGASVPLDSNLAGDTPASSHGTTTATFFIPGEFDLTSTNNGTLEIDCSSCAEGYDVDYSISGADPTIAGPEAAATGAPEPSSLGLMLSGLAGLALLVSFARRKRQAAAVPFGA